MQNEVIFFHFLQENKKKEKKKSVRYSGQNDHMNQKCGKHLTLYKDFSVLMDFTLNTLDRKGQNLL